jgi:hypothetical protein
MRLRIPGNRKCFHGRPGLDGNCMNCPELAEALRGNADPQQLQQPGASPGEPAGPGQPAADLGNDHPAWPDHATVTADSTAERARLQSLADWIAAEIDKEYPLHQGLVRDGLLEQAAPFGGMLTAYRKTLAHVRETLRDAAPSQDRHQESGGGRIVDAGPVAGRPSDTGYTERGTMTGPAEELELGG